MPRIGLFGGSFNPPHAAHQLVALYVLETQPIDELWLVPTWAHPFGKDLASYADRVAMCELAAVALGPRVRVSRAEEELAQRPGFVSSRTLDLIEYLEAPGRELHLVIGADILAETAAWHRWDEVARRAPPIVVRRHGYAGGVGVDLPAVSSTLVRELVRASDPTLDRTALPSGSAENRGQAPTLAGLLPREVLRYIADRRLYG